MQGEQYIYNIVAAPILRVLLPTYAYGFDLRTTRFGVVTHGEGRVLGVSHAITYCTNAAMRRADCQR